MSPRPPLPPELLSKEGDHFYALLNEAEDVAVIVVAVSYIDACLASLLGKRLLKSSVSEKLLDSRAGPLGSFAARSGLAYALGLVGKSMYQDLQVLAELRNEVAHHHFAMQFSTPTISAYCKRLNHAGGLRDASTGQPIFDEAMLMAPRTRFTLSAVMIAQRLLLTALITKHVEAQA